MRIAISGTRGLIGGALAGLLRAEGATVLSIGRGAESDIRWDPMRGQLDARALDGVDAVVHLSGAPIGRRWTRARWQEIVESRVQSTLLMAGSLASMARAPGVLANASAIGFYGSRGGELLSESSAAGAGFLADLVRAWEDATKPASAAGVRVINLRTGVVLSPKGGALRQMLPAFRLGLGGPVGDGRQWMSWISLHDLVRAIRHLLASDLDGPVNVAAPAPVTNAEFARTLGSVLSRPALVRAPAFALRAVFGRMADETLLASQRVVSERLLASGFQFDAPTLAAALRLELGV